MPGDTPSCPRSKYSRVLDLSSRVGIHWEVLVLWSVVLLLAGCTDTASDNQRGYHRSDATDIVLLGTTHLAGSATDRSSSDVSGILSDQRQEELDIVAQHIADWELDQFFVECSPDEQAPLDSAYLAYRNGAYALANPPSRVGRGEIHQIGFRAAEKAGLGGVRCVDAEVVMPTTQVQSVAQEHNPSLLKSHQQYAETGVYPDSLLHNNTLREVFLTLNTDSLLWRNHKNYLYYYARMGSFDGTGERVRRESELSGQTFAAPFEVAERHMKELREAIETVDARLVDRPGPDTDYVILLDRQEANDAGSGTGPDTISVAELNDLIGRTSTTWISFPDHHVGADMVAQWYKRNLRIYANISQQVEEDDRRVLLLMGQAHIWPLRQFFRDNPDFRVVPVQEVL